MRPTFNVLFRCVVLIASVVALPVPAVAQLPPLFQNSVPLPVPDGGFVGRRVALDGDTAIIANTQQAWIVERESLGWSEPRPLTELAATEIVELAVNGNTAVVLRASFGIVETTAYVHERNLGGPDAWGLAAVLAHPVGAGVAFLSPSIALKGDVLVIGVPEILQDGLEDTDIHGGTWGEVYVHRRNQGGPSAWGLVKALPHDPHGPQGAPPTFFGLDVAIDGDTIVVAGITYPPVGSCTPPSGDWCLSTFAQVFERDRGGPDNWGLASSLPVTLPDAYRLARAQVVLDGDTVAVSRMAADPVQPLSTYVQIFERSPGSSEWTQAGNTLRYTGDSELALDGDRLVVNELISTPIGARRLIIVLARHQDTPDGWGHVQDLVMDTHRGGFSAFGVAVSGPSVLVGDALYRPDPNVGPTGAVVEFVSDIDRDSRPDNEDPCPKDPLDNIAGRCRRTIMASPLLDDDVQLLGVSTSRAGGSFLVTARFENTGADAILNPFFSIASLSDGNLLANGDGEPAGVGATLTADVGDGVWMPHEILRVTFVIQLGSQLPFQFFVHAQGEPTPVP